VLRTDEVDYDHFKAPFILPILGALFCAFLAGPWARSDEQQEQYVIAGGLMVVGLVLWVITWLVNRGARAKKTGFRDIEHMEDDVH
jgi:basic amino acid/polyamine antiporter, APA family